MSTTTSTPSFTDNITIVTTGNINRGTVARETFDWRSKFGGYLFVYLGRSDAVALSSPIQVIVRRTINNDGIIIPNSVANLFSKTAAAVQTSCAASGNNAGVTTLTVAATASYNAGDLIVIDGIFGSGNVEWNKIAQVINATSLLLESPTAFAHNNTLDIVRSNSDVWGMWLDGGATYELLMDYAAQSTGSFCLFTVMAQTFDSESTA